MPPVKPEEALQNFVRRNFEEVSKANPGHYQPKEDKFLEWTLFQILEQLKWLNGPLVEIAHNQKMKG
jgi:hypothetical protein